MARKKRNPNILLRLLILLVLISTVVGAALISPPKRALSIAAAAISNKFLDRPDRNTEHKIPVLDIEVATNDLEQLNADLPWSGGTQVPVTWKHKGIDHVGTFRYRGLVAPSHYLGAKKSFRLKLKKSNPYRPLKSLNVINPKSINMVNNHMALWIGSYMGVSVPFDELVFVRMNGEDHGVMELFEQIDGNFERSRNIRHSQAPVYKGDFPPLQGRSKPIHRSLWQNANHWQYRSKADSSEARLKLEGLIQLIKAQSKGALDTLPVDFRDTLSHFIDLDAFVRYTACLKVLNTMHIDNYHNQWLVLNESGKFYPVLWDALLMFPLPNEPWYPIHDALAFHVLSIPECRLERDRLVYSYTNRMHTDSAFHHELRRVQNELRPSLMADPNKEAAITSDPYDIFRFSSVHAAISSDKLASRCSEYWSSVLSQCAINDLEWSHSDTVHTFSWSGNASVELNFGSDTLPLPEVNSGTRKINVYSKEGNWTCHLVPIVAQRGAEKPYHYSDRTFYAVNESKFRLAIGNSKGPMELKNAITNETIETK